VRLCENPLQPGFCISFILLTPYGGAGLTPSLVMSPEYLVCSRVLKIWMHATECKALNRQEWSGRADLNCRPLAPQASALPG
jgi:hypothetical protein